MKQPVLFIGGFPRSGSSLLVNILAQNPKLFPTGTSGVIGSVLNLRDNWRSNDVYKAMGEEFAYPRIRTMMKNMIIGFYEKEILNKQIPIDKNRAWVHHIDLLEELFQTKVKFIYPIRNVLDCTISMEKVNRKSTLTNHGDNGNILDEQTTEGRARNFLKDDGVMGSHIVALREIHYRGLSDRLVYVPYNDLLTYPKETLNRVYNELGLETYTHDFDNIKQTVFEQDLMHGFAPNSLHKIREGKLGLPNPTDTTIYSQKFMNEINETFKDVDELINKISLSKK